MSTTKKIPKKKVALLLSTLTPPLVVAHAQHFVLSMTGNANFPNPSPALATVSAEATALDAAYSLSMTRAKGASDKMHAARKVLTLSLGVLAAYVESIANADPDNAASIISSAGMNERKVGVRSLKGFTVTVGIDPGTVKINTKAEKRAIYVYQETNDPTNTAGWATIYTGNTTKFLKTGLTSGSRYYFRYATILKGVQGNWSPVVNVMVP